MWSTGILDTANFALLVLLPLLVILVIGVIVGIAVSVDNKKREPTSQIPVAINKQFPLSTKECLIDFVRSRTRASLALAKRALEESEYDVEAAIRLLSATRAGRKSDAGYGIVHTYNYLGKAAVMVELNCDKESTVSSLDTRLFVEDLCVHLAVANPKMVTRSYLTQAWDPFCSIPPPPPTQEDVPLVEQEMGVPGYAGKTVGQVAAEVSSRLGDNLRIRRFNVYQIAGNTKLT